MSRSVLLIEDNAQNRYLVTFLLEHHGYVVRPAPDGPTGLAMAVIEPPDMVLLDIQLPMMDGYEVARELRRLDGTRTTPIIAVTSYAMAGDRQKAFAAGCTGYIEKPINPDTFIDEIEQFLRPATGADR